ncbi:MAG: PAC2 family protein [Thaumarchaeota archaeon]|nr:PAC2 family protein [Nitrososphaerota archaeon]
MWERLDVDESPDVTDGVLLISLSTMAPQYKALYSHARELSKYMLRKMDFKRFATLYSSSLPPAVSIGDDGLAMLHSNSFYLHEGKRPIVMLAGDGSPFDDQQQYAHRALSFAQQLGTTSVVSIGARWADSPLSPSSPPRPVGFASTPEGVKELEGYGVTITKSEPGPFFPNLVVGMAESYGMRGYKLGVDHGEPRPHPRSLVQILGILMKMLDFEIEVKELEAQATEVKALESQDGLPEVRRERRGIYG